VQHYEVTLDLPRAFSESNCVGGVAAAHYLYLKANITPEIWRITNTYSSKRPKTTEINLLLDILSLNWILAKRILVLVKARNRRTSAWVQTSKTVQQRTAFMISMQL